MSQKLPKYIVLHKKRGETPLEVITAWKALNPLYAQVPMSYAGRLDPMAEGRLLVLVGNECKRQRWYTKFDKEYDVEMVFDLQTDTLDALGIPNYGARTTNVTEDTLQKAITRVRGTHTVPYPAFSSKTVAGVPLFVYALEGTLSSITIPEHAETIHSVSVLSIDKVATPVLRERIEKALQVIPHSTEPSKELGANFRQEVIRPGWRTLLDHIGPREFTVVTLRVVCGSGSYMRTLTKRIASQFGTEAFALSITRTKIGKYHSFGPLRFWGRRF